MTTRGRPSLDNAPIEQLRMNVGILAMKAAQAADWHEQMAKALRAQAIDLQDEANRMSPCVEAAWQDRRGAA